MKKLISILLLVCMIFSMSVVSYSEDLADDGGLQLVSSYVTSKYIFLDFSEAVLFDEAVQNNTLLTIKDDTVPVLYTVSTQNDGKTLVLEVTGGMDIEEVYTLNIPFIYNTDKTKFLFGTKVDISFAVYWNDDFEDYETKADLDSAYVNVTGGATKAFSSLNSCDLLTDSDGNNKMLVNIPGDETGGGVWILASEWDKKYYTFEADFESITPDQSVTTNSTIFDYHIHDKFISNSQTIRFSNLGYKIGGGNMQLFTESKAHHNVWDYDTYKPADITDMTVTISTYKLGTSDAVDIFWDSNYVFHDTGTINFTANNNLIGAISPHSNSSFYIDNWKIYVSNVEFSTVGSYTGIIPAELYINGVLEKDSVISVDIADDTNPKATTVYEWYRGIDKDAPLTDTEKWTLIPNTSKSYTVTETDVEYYIVCRVKKTFDFEVNGEDFIIFDITTPALLAPYAPECRDLELTYTKGDTKDELKASFNYYDANFESQNGTVVTWEESLDNVTWTPLSETAGITGDTTTDTLDVTDVINKYIKCTVTVKNDGRKGDEAIPVTKNYTLPFEPVATRVEISGTASVNSLLQADYDYFDANGDEQKGTKFIWYKKSGTTETVVSEDSLAYIVQPSDSGYSIGFKVIPKNEVYPQSTTEYRSNEIAIPAAVVIPSYSGSSGGGGSYSGGGSSGGGSYTATASSSVIVDESKDNEKVLEALKESTKPAFEDIKNHWAENEISELSEKGIVKGRENGFEPDAMITRAEWLTLLLRGIEEETASEYKAIFNDVKEDDWYREAVEKAYSLGLVSGDGENFNPNAEITREQMAKMAVLVYEYKNGEITDSKDIEFSDKDNMSDWAEEYIKKAVSAELMNGVTESEFAFSASATRAQACVLLSRIIDNLK